VNKDYIEKIDRNFSSRKINKTPKYKLIEPKSKKLTLSSALRSKINN